MYLKKIYKSLQVPTPVAVSEICVQKSCMIEWVMSEQMDCQLHSNSLKSEAE